MLTAENDSFFMKLSKILSYLYVSMVISPYFMNNQMMVVVFIAAAWIMISLLTVHVYEGIYAKLFLGVFVWFIYEFIYRFLGISSVSIGNYYMKTFFWISLLIFAFYKNIEQDEHLIRLGKWITAWLFVNIVDNIRLQIQYSSILQYYTDDDTYLSNTNLGDTMFAFAAMLFVLISAVGIVESVGRQKLKWVISSIVGIVYLMLVGRATAFILAIVGMLIIFIIYALSRMDIKAVALLVVVFGIIMFGYYALNHEELLAKIITNERIRIRVLGILGSEGGDDSGLTARIEVMKISWNSFINHPIFGIGFHMSQNVSTAASVGIGQHCEIVDLLAKYGIVGFSINFWLFRNFYVAGFWEKKNTQLGLINTVVLCILIVYSFLNHSMHICVGPIFFIAFPYLDRIIQPVGKSVLDNEGM